MKIFSTKKIKIKKEDLNDAKMASAAFKDSNVQKRAFLNVLGARIALNYLFSQRIEANNVYSLYTINSIREKLDIADIYYNNLNLDIRVVFDENEIFIPKSHFLYDIEPDLYIVIKAQNEFESAEFLGYFTPDCIDRTSENNEYYFIENKNLQNNTNIKKYLKTIKKHSARSGKKLLTKEKVEELFVKLIDKNINNTDFEELIFSLAKDTKLRERLSEFENFEYIANNTTESNVQKTDSLLGIVGTQDNFDETQEETLEEALADDAAKSANDVIEEALKLADETIENVIPVVESLAEGEVLAETVSALVQPEENITDEDSESYNEELSATEEIPQENIEQVELEDNTEIQTDLFVDNDEIKEDELVALDSNIDMETDLSVDVDEVKEDELVALDGNIDMETDLSVDVDEVKEDELVALDSNIDMETDLSVDVDEVKEDELVALDSNIDMETDLSTESNNTEEEDTLISFDEAISIKEEEKAKKESYDVGNIDDLFDDIEEEELQRVENNSLESDETTLVLPTLKPLDFDSEEIELKPKQEETYEYSFEMSKAKDEEFEKESLYNDTSEIIENSEINEVEIKAAEEEEEDNIADLSILDDITNITQDNEEITSPIVIQSEPQINFEDLIPEPKEETQESDLLDEALKNSLNNEKKSNVLTTLFMKPNKKNTEEVNDKTAPSYQITPQSITLLISSVCLLFTSLIALGTFIGIKLSDNSAKKIQKAQPAPVEEVTEEDINIAPLSNPLSQPITASVSDISWEVPENLAYNDIIREFLQIAGKNIKLNLQNDLLLVTDYSYSQKVVVDIVLDGKLGSVKYTEVSTSSGSKTIDKTIVDTVKKTLEYIKLPSTDIQESEIALSLVVSF